MTEHNYSIDALTERIHSAKTRDYFKEVILTYYSGAFRSCIVTLYSVVICDLVFKLEELSDIYNDDAARKILKEISDKQQSNPKSPDWETEILELIKQRTTLLELFEVEAIYQLQKQRHLSAHPVLTSSSILYTPNKETITAHIKNMLEFVLTKPPFFSKKLATAIIDDLSENKDRLISNTDLKRYLEAKYFKNARQELFNNLFKLLWKFSFKLSNDECEENRKINVSTLRIIYDKERLAIENFVKSDQGHFSFLGVHEVLNQLFEFLFDFPRIYTCLNQENKILIDVEIENKKKYKFLSWFKYDNFDEFLVMIKQLISDGYSPSGTHYYKVLILADQFGKRKEMITLGVEMFGHSGSFDSADTRFSRFIEPFLEEMDETQLKIAINKIEYNYQINSRRKASSDNNKVRKAMLQLNPEFDFSPFSHFR